MDRRLFVKNSLFALFSTAIASNKGLASIAETLTPQSPKVVLYLIQNIKGQWKVRGSKWLDVPTKKLDKNKVLLETFKLLEIVDNDIANKRRNELWIKYNCSGTKGGPLNVVISQARAIKAHSSPKMLSYIYSEQWKFNFDKGRAKGKPADKWSFELGKINVDSGWLDKIRPADAMEHYSKMTNSQKKIWHSQGGKAASIVNLKSGQIKMAQQLAAQSQRKKVIDLSTNIIYDSLKEVSKQFNLNYGSLKNTLQENGRKNKTNFRYI